ncbi:MAG: hypothetical protein ACHQ4G_06470 [Opitutales bacterium]
MQNFPRRFLPLAVLFVAFASFSRAQLLTADSIGTLPGPGVGYSQGQSLGANTAITQTFSGFDSINTLTFQFLAADTLQPASTLAVYFSAWDTTNNVATTEIGVATLNLSASSAWTTDSAYYNYNASLDLSSVASGLDPAQTYALTIVGDPSGASASINLAGNSGSYTTGSSGGAFSTSGVGTFSDLASNTASPLITDIAFTADSSTPAFDAVLSAVPEASTVTVLFAALFVSGLVFLRVRQRRQLALASVQA